MFVWKILLSLVVIVCSGVVVADDPQLPPGVCLTIIRGKTRRVCCDKYEVIKGKCRPICDPVCENGYCSAPNECACWKDYHKFSDNRCVPTCASCEHGSCIGPNHCKCFNGYERLNNTCVPVCENGCENGICTKPNECTCLDNYVSDPLNPHKCSPICDLTCENGRCAKPNFCECNDGYERDSTFTCRLAPESTCTDEYCKDGICLEGICIPPTDGKSESKFFDNFDGIDFNEFEDEMKSTIDLFEKEINSEIGQDVLNNIIYDEEISHQLDSDESECKTGYFWNEISHACEPVCHPAFGSVCENGFCDSMWNCRCLEGFKLENSQCVPDFKLQATEPQQTELYEDNSFASLYYLLPTSLFCALLFIAIFLVIRSCTQRRQYKPYTAEQSEKTEHFLKPNMKEFYA